MIHVRRLDNKVPVCQATHDPHTVVFQDVPDNLEDRDVCEYCMITLERWNREEEIEDVVNKILAHKPQSALPWQFWFMFVCALILGFLSGYATYISF